MICLLSPSKSMDMEPVNLKDFTEPLFLEKSQQLISRARKFSTAELMEFMEISEKLAELNRQRFNDWNLPFTLENAKQAVFAFTGDVYDGLDAGSLKKADLNFAQEHLRILSGLYGLLKPLDLIQPYRLEMSRPLETRGAKNLYQFWSTLITEELNQTPGDAIINLASNEYFKAIDKKTLKKDIISPVFKDGKNGTFKIISFFAKKARGAMARFIIENRVTSPEELLKFNESGYAFNPELSTPATPVFTRPEKRA
ncbi:peroxide stress protein YaaA [Verrucomicrobia bacterium S94]|nr:peroxide stress protein YaaA [Verrucomicrobia bacterium S94]